VEGGVLFVPSLTAATLLSNRELTKYQAQRFLAIITNLSGASRRPRQKADDLIEQTRHSLKPA
jgi:hypothetical protein